jgi:beta-phosphoglucomutase-like phosphatase (HAD superfamily)
MLAAILFDLDGTIVNTDPIHYRAWREMLLNYSIEIDETFYKSRISGRLNPEIVEDKRTRRIGDKGKDLL